MEEADALQIRARPGRRSYRPRPAIHAVCFPHEDEGFVAHVQRILTKHRARVSFQAAVQATLRETYPLAVISPREALAALDGNIIWYVYRDGSFFRRTVDQGP